jgi:hypothetical protein
LSYEEAKAIAWLSTYGSTAFIKAVKSYIPSPNCEGNEVGLKQFIESMRALQTTIEHINAANKVVRGPYELMNTVRQWQPADP